MKRRALLTLFVLVCAVSGAQNNGAWLIPRVVYAGDRATLVLPLPETAQNGGGAVPGAQSLLLPENNFPYDANIDFHRIALERRASGTRLLIEFTAFAPGILELPVIEIGEMRFSGLTVAINSVLDASRSAPELLSPASALAMPGTALMLYGTMAGVVFLLLLALWFILRGQRYLQIWIDKWRRWHLFASMKSVEKSLRRALLKGGNKRYILDKLSQEFRMFLSFFTGNNCRSMTAREFEALPLNLEFDGGFLGKFFRRCDILRFSGADVISQDIDALLADLRLFLATMEKAKGERA